MEHYLDIETELFEKVKKHKTTEMRISRSIDGREVKTGDTLKLYHLGDETEALRVEITGVETTGVEETVQEMSEREDCDAEQAVTVSFSLLEWMCRLETELDELLRQEEMWMRGLL